VLGLLGEVLLLPAEEDLSLEEPEPDMPPEGALLEPEEDAEPDADFLSKLIWTLLSVGGLGCVHPAAGNVPAMDFIKVTLFTDRDGRARFREEPIALPEGTPQAMLSKVFASSGYQLRHSPVGFRSQWHCTPNPQWVFILSGEMEIGLQDGSSRLFKAGQHFFSSDTLPAGASFDPEVHGHWSAQRGKDPLVTLFVKA
jgi:hypothetical protein